MEDTIITATFVFEKETKNTIRFSEEPGTTAPIVNTIYVQKWAVNNLGNPDKIRVTIEAVE